MRNRRVVIVVFPGVLGVDAFGPADVFYFADYLAERAGEPRLPYDVEFAAAEVGAVPTAAGPSLHAARSIHDPTLRPDVLLVAGGLAAVTTARDADFVAGVAGLAERSGEVGSVCTGAVILAAAGLLDGRRAATHWALADQVRAEYPELDVDPDRIFVHDGVWSSAGVTAGIDLALQIVQTHHGQPMAAEAARHMVVYLRRAGGQQQYSTHLAAQESVSPTLGDLLSYIADHPSRDLSVAALAERANMSERSFQRLFMREVGVSPGKYVEQTRIDAARRLLEQTEDGVAGIAGHCGFTNAETFHRSFKRRVGVTPTEYRQRFAG
ncbi:MAG: helix-turn-helix domain-containing protein [Candidatus Limnocylindrales bacterium]